MYDQAVIRSQAAGGAYTFATLPTASQMQTSPIGVMAYTTDFGAFIWTGSTWMSATNFGVAKRPKTITMLGDSMVAQSGSGNDIYYTGGGNTSSPNYSAANLATFLAVETNSLFPHSSWLLQACMRTGTSVNPYQFNYGQSGATSTTVAASNGVIQYLLNTPASTYGLPDMCVVLCGTNDLPPNAFSLTTVLSNLSSIYTQLISIGVMPIAATLPPSIGAGAPSAVRKINEGIMRLAQSYKIPVADFYSALMNASTGQWGQSAWTFDNVHPSARGRAIMGAVLGNVLNSMFSGAVNRVSSYDDSTDTTVTRYPNFVGITGTINTAGSYPTPFTAPGITTTVFDGTGATEQGGTFSMYTSATLPDSLTPNRIGNSWQLQGTGTATTYGSSGSSIAVAAGDRIALSFRVKLVADLSATNGWSGSVRLLNGSTGKSIMGFQGEAAFGRTGTVGIGNETGYIAGDFYQEIIAPTLTGGATSLALRVDMNNTTSNGTNLNDYLVLANFQARNLTKLGIAY